MTESRVETEKLPQTWEEIQGISTNVLRGVYGYGFDNPSPIQKQAIAPVIQGQDVIAQAQSGTGKTGCFTVACLSRIDMESKTTQALIMAPTRELARQIHSVTMSVGTYMGSDENKLVIKLLVGGTSTEEDTASLRNDVPHVIVGTPGRIHDMLRRRHIKSQNLSLLILDEADEMLSVGFKEQVYNVFQFLKSDVQVALFSATLPPDLITLTNKFMRDPVRILVKSEQLTLEGIRQHYIALDQDGEKYETLRDLYRSLAIGQCIIYCNSVRRVQDLYEAMKADDYRVCCIHSAMDKTERSENYDEFRRGSFNVLISSNVTARGIDIQSVSTVVNFDMPKDTHTYLHRIGRSGRWGRKGVAINFATKRDYKKMKEIERYYNTTITELPSSFVQ
jgi:translation initiation factor 4A